jgi:hypothetical protein
MPSFDLDGVVLELAALLSSPRQTRSSSDRRSASISGISLRLLEELRSSPASRAAAACCGIGSIRRPPRPCEHDEVDLAAPLVVGLPRVVVAGVPPRLSLRSSAPGDRLRDVSRLCRSSASVPAGVVLAVARTTLTRARALLERSMPSSASQHLVRRADDADEVLHHLLQVVLDRVRVLAALRSNGASILAARPPTGHLGSFGRPRARCVPWRTSAPRTRRRACRTRAGPRASCRRGGWRRASRRRTRRRRTGPAPRHLRVGVDATPPMT